MPRGCQPEAARAIRALAARLERLGVTVTSARADERIAMLSAGPVTVWCTDVRLLQWHEDGAAVAWTTSNMEGAASRIAARCQQAAQVAGAGAGGPVREACVLAAALQARGPTAFAAGICVHVHTAADLLLIAPSATGAGALWRWSHGGAQRAHPRAGISAAAWQITACLHGARPP